MFSGDAYPRYGPHTLTVLKLGRIISQPPEPWDSLVLLHIFLTKYHWLIIFLHPFPNTLPFAPSIHDCQCPRKNDTWLLSSTKIVILWLEDSTFHHSATEHTLDKNHQAITICWMWIINVIIHPSISVINFIDKQFKESIRNKILLLKEIKY